MPPVSITLITPQFAVPRLSAESVTLGFRVLGFDALTQVAWRVYAEGASELPPKVIRKLDGLQSSRDVYFTWDGLEAGTTYVAELEATSVSGTLAGSSTVTFLGTSAPLFPEGELGDFDWEDYPTQWMGLLAWYYQSDPFMLAWVRRIGAEMQRLDTAIEQVTRFAFPAEAYGEGLRRWEDVYGVDLQDAATDEQRRALLLVFTAARIRASALSFLEAINSLQAGISGAFFTEEFGSYTLNVFLSGSDSERAVVKEVIRRIVPAHLSVVYGAAQKVFSGPRRRVPIGALYHRGRSSLDPVSAGFDRGRFS